MTPNRAWLVVVALTSIWFAPPIAAQDVTISGPYNRIHDSFYEHFGIHWGFRGRGIFFDNGGGGGGGAGPVPQFGGFDPAADARFGFGGRNFFFNFSASQGNRRSMVSSSPMITLPQGGIGTVADSSIRPFVTGIVPVVGERSTTPLHERLERLKAGEVPHPSSAKSESRRQNDTTTGGDASASDSTANRGDLSVAEIRRQQAADDAAKQAEVEALIEQARGFEERGKPGVARVYYQQAAKRATGDLQKSLKEKVQSLSIPAKAAKSR